MSCCPTWRCSRRCVGWAGAGCGAGSARALAIQGIQPAGAAASMRCASIAFIGCPLLTPLVMRKLQSVHAPPSACIRPAGGLLGADRAQQRLGRQRPHLHRPQGGGRLGAQRPQALDRQRCAACAAGPPASSHAALGARCPRRSCDPATLSAASCWHTNSAPVSRLPRPNSPPLFTLSFLCSLRPYLLPPAAAAAPWCDIAVIWARNTESGAVNAFIVRCKSNPGYSCTKIENKIALRCVQVWCAGGWVGG